MLEILPYSVETLILLFFIYSFCGWVMESFLQFIEKKKFINRGFFIGPYCPIYGCGGILMTIFLRELEHSPFQILLASTLLCTVLEYVTSYLMEKLFKARWWDYSHKLFHLNGRVCLENAIMFGFAGVLLIRYINPLLLDMIYAISGNLRIWLSGLLVGIFLLDNIVSFAIIGSFRRTVTRATEDNTEEITKRVKAVTDGLKVGMQEKAATAIMIITKLIADARKESTKKIKAMFEKSPYLYRRLLQAYPNLEIRGISFHKIKREIMKKGRGNQQK